MKITLLGTGAPAPSARRAGSGYVVQIAGETFVFDHGPGAHARMLQAGIPLTDVTQLFLTHFHYDHFTDVASLLLRRWDQGAGRVDSRVPQAGQPHLRVDGASLPAISTRAGSVALARGGAGSRARPHPVTELQHGSTVEAAAGRFAPSRRAAVDFPCVPPGLRSLVYSGDTGPCDALVPRGRTS